MAEKTRQERIDNGTLVPNSFQHPNLYVDWLHFYLTPEEIVVLDKAIREILGWEENISDRKARIALSIFMEGKIGVKSGRQLCLGCGLGIHAVRKALTALNHYRILVKDGKPTQQGQMFKLQDKAELIDWDGLEARRERWDDQNRKRTKSATKASLVARGLTSDVEGNVPRYPNPLRSEPDPTTTPESESDEEGTSDVGISITSDVGTDLTSDADNETQKDLSVKETSNDLLWEAVLGALKGTQTGHTFGQFLLDSHLVAADNGSWTVQIQNAQMLDWMQDRLIPSQSFQRVLAQYAPNVQEIRFVAKEEPTQ